MRIAVAYKDGEIFEHFGHCEMFAIYDYEDADVNKCTKRLVETAGREGHKAMSDLMREEKIDAVIAGNMGGEAKALLLSYGIIPIVGFLADDEHPYAFVTLVERGGYGITVAGAITNGFLQWAVENIE